MQIQAECSCWQQYCMFSILHAGHAAFNTAIKIAGEVLCVAYCDVMAAADNPARP